MQNTELYTVLKNNLTKPYNADKIVTMVAAGVSFLATVTTIPNPDKKKLLLDVLIDVIADADIPDETKALLISLTKTLGDQLIESLISIGKSKLFVKAKSLCC